MKYSTLRVHVPAWNGNRELPESERARVHWKLPTFGWMLHNTARADASDHEKAMDVYRENVVRIENLEIDGVPITTAAELLALPDVPFSLIEDFIVRPFSDARAAAEATEKN